jgi:hypothetical protein
MNQFIEKNGKSRVVDLLPSLFITIDTNNFEKKEILYDYQDLVPTTFFMINDFAKHNIKNFTGTIYDIAPIVELINEIPANKLPSNIDCIFVSYLGKYIVQMKNTGSNQHGKSLYLDVHTVRIALTDMQTQKYVNWSFICTGALFLSFFYGNFSIKFV